jgi:preprotein translocase subunit SecG
MLTFVSIVHVLLCVFMIFVILLQPGKDAGMGAALGGGAATSAFGGRGAVTFLGKITAVCAIGFFITALGLSFVGLKTSVAAGIAAPPTAPPGTVAIDGGTGTPNLEQPAGTVPAAPAAVDAGEAAAPAGTGATPAVGGEAPVVPAGQPVEAAPSAPAPAAPAPPAPAPANP